ncbi:MAG: ABC transporter permease subunit [Candidatus Latescibacteria bacterium]|nr:ABC transporter permease subunit [Candidatus Latescibacterota bacterium]
MFKTIYCREILETIKSKTFLIGFVVTVFLVILSIIINLEDYLERRNDYQRALHIEQEGIAKVFRQPQPLSVFAQGKDKKYGTTHSVSYWEIDTAPSGYLGIMSNHGLLHAGESAFDYTFIVRVVLSLLTIFVAYHKISGDRAIGTLKFSLSNSLSRNTLLLGKFLSGLTIILISLTGATLISLIIVILHSGISFGISEWIRIFGMFTVSALYVTVFYMISLFISVVTSRPSISLMISLQLWLFLIVIYPNTGVLITKKFYSVPSERDISERKSAAERKLRNPVDNTLIELQGKIRSKINFDENVRELNKIKDSLDKQKTIMYYRIDREYHNELNRQAYFAKMITILSPAILYDKIMIRLAKTGVDDFDRFLDALIPFYDRINNEGFFERDPVTYEGPKLTGSQLAYSYSSERFEESLFAILPDMMILLMFCILCYTGSHTAFLRRDVR